MHNSKKTKPAIYLVIITGFIMIVSLCIMTKNKSHIINNNYNGMVERKDTLKNNTNAIDISIEEEIQDIFSIWEKARENIRSVQYSF